MSRLTYLHVITNGKQELREILPVLQQVVQGGADTIHLREKHRTDKEMEAWLHAITSVVPKEKVIINERIVLAQVYGCKGVHLGQQAISEITTSKSKVALADQLLGCSIHNMDELHRSMQIRPSYLIAGHIYETKSKPGSPPRGLELLRELKSILASSYQSIPLLAIGGIKPEHVAHVLEAGADGIAVMSTIMEANDPFEMTKRYKKALDEGRKYA
ncbi:thiamine phosphate synthase [Brevibacillus daliensis]|uniref:thiamine phosphate synthase n=1 Tax=Brevibacillus daliensis TaxID=2892995 RepID=UPI001E6328EA|nr:thiamine phosphate synthase [Brevibacillus daliensis]